MYKKKKKKKATKANKHISHLILVTLHNEIKGICVVYVLFLAFL